MELSKTQEEILASSAPVIFVQSSAASGKTRLLTEKIRQSISRAKKLVAFTFTNMAAAEIRSRLNVENSDVIWIGTIHSYCARCLLRAGVTEAGKYLADERFDDLFKLALQHPNAFPSLDICLLDVEELA